MSENQALDTGKQTKKYILILIALVALTFLSVGLSRTGIPAGARVVVALVIAIAQGFLSVSFLMHLNWERRFIYGVLLLTVVFFAALILLPLLTSLDTTGVTHVP